MTRENPVEELELLSRRFGPAAAARKRALLAELVGAGRIGVRDLLVLHDSLCFMRAYPDDRRVLAGVASLAAELRRRAEEDDPPGLEDSGFPGSRQVHEFSYATVRAMAALFPGCVEIDWDGFADRTVLHNALVLVVTVGEHQGLDDTSLSFEDWFARAKGPGPRSDLEFLLELLERSNLASDQRAFVFDACGIPVRFELSRPGTGRCEAVSPPRRIHYQKRDLAADTRPLAQVVGRPPRMRRGGREQVELARTALCARNLQISPLMNADARDVLVAESGRGIEIALVGIAPEERDPLESSFFLLVCKNGVPIGYGPASVLLGCCELGINLFPEFRGSEVRFVYGEYMRLLHHALGADNFFLTRYAMGEENEAALRSGAFWFYRKLGFRPLQPEVEVLAREEERRMLAQPGYRSNRRTLRKLSHTEACFDLSGGRSPQVDFARLGLRQTRFIDEHFDGDRASAERVLTARVARRLEIRDLASWSPPERRALRILAPILAQVFAAAPGRASWSTAEKRAAARLCRLKGSRSERGFDRALRAHTRLAAALAGL